MTDRDRRGTPELVTIRFASRMLNGSQETLGSPAPPSDGDTIELESISRDQRERQLC